MLYLKKFPDNKYTFINDFNIEEIFYQNLKKIIIFKKCEHLIFSSILNFTNFILILNGVA